MDLIKPGDQIPAAAINAGIKSNRQLQTIKVGSGMVARNFPGGIFLDALAQAGVTINYGSLVSTWTPGNLYVVVTPCAKDGTIAATPPANVNVYLQGISFFETAPTNQSLPVQFDAQALEVLMYFSFDGKNYLFSPPVPTVQATGGAQYMVYQLGGANGPGMFDYPRAAP